MLGTVEFIDSDDGRRLRQVRIRVKSCKEEESRVLDIRTEHCIGKGSFGTVYQAVLDGFPSIALKVTTGKPSRLQQELDVLRRVCTKGHLSLPRFEFGALNAANDLLLIGMELCIPSTLHDLLLHTRLTSEADMLFICYQAAQALLCVHTEGCIHRDVKLQNFIFDVSGNLKLIDFGLSSNTVKPPAGDIVAGTISFMAPEMAYNALHREKRVSVGISADIWSLGIAFFSIVTQRNPYAAPTGDSPSQKELLERVEAADWHWPEGSQVSPALRELIGSLLVKNPSERPDIQTILKHKVWNLRRRTPPAAITAFLGVQDDLLVSADESCLMRAVEKVTLQGDSEGREPSVDLVQEKDSSLAGRTSIKVMSGGDGEDRIYDVRTGCRRDGKTLRELAVVIRDESITSNRKRKSVGRSQSNGSALLSPPLGTPDGAVTSSMNASADPFLTPPAATVRPDAAVWRSRVHELSAWERRERQILTRKLTLNHQWLMKTIQIFVTEDQERCNAVWLSAEQAKSASHPHSFVNISKKAEGKYKYGYVCDMCDYEYLPTTKNTLFYFHCSCGRDLCPTCYERYVDSCTCPTCRTSFHNVRELQDHLQTKCSTVQQTKRQRAEKLAAAAAEAEEELAEEPPKKKVRAARVAVAIVKSSPPPSPRKRGKAQRAPSAPRARMPRVSYAMEKDKDDGASEEKSRATRSATPAMLKPVEVRSPQHKEKWEPFAKLRQERKRVELPTDEEKETILNGQWVRYFYLYPSGDEGEPEAFVYLIQLGRTGAIFLLDTFTIHSAVFSLLERLFCVIESVNISDGNDVARMTTLVQAKAHPPLENAFLAMQEIVGYDTNMRKQQRSIGTSSVYQAPRTSYSSNGQTFIYVRWFRFNEDKSITAVLLSNGAVQVFVRNEYELRWFDDNRMFLVRGSGACEVVDRNIEIFSKVEHLLFDPVDP